MEMRASHILVSDKALADKIYIELKNGLNFQVAARRYSKCPSKEKGGDLGWFKEGAMVKEFENETKKLSYGAISKPFRTQFGYHIVKKLGVR